MGGCYSKVEKPKKPIKSLQAPLVHPSKTPGRGLPKQIAPGHKDGLDTESVHSGQLGGSKEESLAGSATSSVTSGSKLKFPRSLIRTPTGPQSKQRQPRSRPGSYCTGENPVASVSDATTAPPDIGGKSPSNNKKVAVSRIPKSASSTGLSTTSPGKAVGRIVGLVKRVGKPSASASVTPSSPPAEINEANPASPEPLPTITHIPLPRGTILTCMSVKEEDQQHKTQQDDDDATERTSGADDTMVTAAANKWPSRSHTRGRDGPYSRNGGGGNPANIQSIGITLLQEANKELDQMTASTVSAVAADEDSLLESVADCQNTTPATYQESSENPPPQAPAPTESDEPTCVTPSSTGEQSETGQSLATPLPPSPTLARSQLNVVIGNQPPQQQHQHTMSLCSLNSDDLMLTTDVGLDEQDDDVIKDLDTTEKEDPFLTGATDDVSAGRKLRVVGDSDECETLSRATGSTSSGERTPQPARSQDPLYVPEEEEKGDKEAERTSVAVCGSCGEDEASSPVGRPLLRRLRSVPVRGGTSYDPDRPRSLSSPLRLYPRRRVGSLVSPIADASGQSSAGDLGLDFDLDPEAGLMAFPLSEHRQMLNNVSHIKLMLHKLKRMLADDHGHLPAFFEQLVANSNSTQWRRDSCVSEPSTPLTAGTPYSPSCPDVGPGVLNFGSRCPTSCWDQQFHHYPATSFHHQAQQLPAHHEEGCNGSGELEQEVTLLRQENSALRARLAEREQTIALLQQQMSKYTCPIPQQGDYAAIPRKSAEWSCATSSPCTAPRLVNGLVPAAAPATASANPVVPSPGCHVDTYNNGPVPASSTTPNPANNSLPKRPTCLPVETRSKLQMRRATCIGHVTYRKPPPANNS